jgi:hypothetical protein
MPLFPVLEIEALVQENDKTRLDGSKSYAGGVGPITLTEIKPGEGGSFIDVTTDGFLDWQFEPGIFDVALGVNDSVDFSEGGSELQATLTPGEYTLTGLIVEVENQMNAVGALTYTISLSADNEITIAATGDFELLGKSGTSGKNILPSLGFPDDTEGEPTYTGAAIEKYTRAVYLKVTNADPSTQTIVRTLETISEADDRLFSTDDMLRKRETDILKYLPDGRSTWKDIHRAAQGLMMVWLDTNGYIDDFGDKLTVKRIKDITEVQEWATQVCLRLIFDMISNTVNDVFYLKARQYQKMEEFFRNRAVLRIDLNKDGIVDLGESLPIQDCLVVRR